MTTLSTISLDHVRGGVQSGNSREQRSERHRNLCLLPTPAEAENHYRQMQTWGDQKIWKKTVDAIGKECGWKPKR